MTPSRSGWRLGLARIATPEYWSTLRVLRGVARNPIQRGAIAPSSRQLARAMVRAAQIQPGQVVVELGAGSGSFTREILECHPDNPLTVFELSPDLAAGLKRDFPRAKVIAASVEELPKLATAFGLGQIDRIISGLPWALWSEPRQAALFDMLSQHLAPGARFVTFHYLHSRSLGRVAKTQHLLRERFVHGSRSATVWGNFPPAYVHIAESPLPRRLAPQGRHANLPPSPHRASNPQQ